MNLQKFPVNSIFAALMKRQVKQLNNTRKKDSVRISKF